MLTDDEVRLNTAENVNRLLQARGWSRRELARRTGDSAMAISRICRGENTAGSGLIARIAEAFDVSIDRLVGPPPKENLRKPA